MADIFDIAAGIAAPVTGGILGIGTANWQDKRQIRQQGKLTEQQLDAQKRLNEFNQELGMRTWHETNYKAQMDELIKAGLNPGLMYGKGGQGGMTMAGPSSSVNGATAPGGSGELGMGMQLGLAAEMTKANIELAKANAMKARTEAEKLGGVDTEEAATRIGKLIAETTNESLKGELIKVQTGIAKIQESKTDEEIQSRINALTAQARESNIKASLTESQFNDLVNDVRLTVIGKQLENELTKSKTTLTDTQKQGIITSLVQKWTELGLNRVTVDQHGRALDQKDIEIQQKQQDIAISKFKAEIEAEYPGAWNVVGSALKKAYNTLENFESAMIYGSGFKGVEDKVK